MARKRTGLKSVPKTTCEETNKVLQVMVADGWRTKRKGGSGHILMEHDLVIGQLTVPATPSDHRTALNIRANARRALRTGSCSPLALAPMVEMDDDELRDILKKHKQSGKLISRRAEMIPPALLSRPKKSAQPVKAKRLDRASPRPIQAEILEINQPEAIMPDVTPQAEISASTTIRAADATVTRTRKAPVRRRLPPAPQVEAETVSVHKISAGLLDLARQIAAGQMKEIVITADMVGSSLWVSGDIALVEGSRPNRKSLASSKEHRLPVDKAISDVNAVIDTLIQIGFPFTSIDVLERLSPTNGKGERDRLHGLIRTGMARRLATQTVTVSGVRPKVYTPAKAA